MSTAVARGIYQKLSGTSAVTSKLASPAAGYGFAIYDQQAPADAEYPFIVVSKSSGTKVRAMGANAFTREVWLVKAVDRNTTSNLAESIAEAVDAALDLGSITVAGKTLADLHHVSDVDYLEPVGISSSGTTAQCIASFSPSRRKGHMKKTYRVTGDLPVHETEPGSTFEAELDREYEARLVERGSVCVVKDAPKSDPVSKKKEQ